METLIDALIRNIPTLIVFVVVSYILNRRRYLKDRFADYTFDNIKLKEIVDTIDEDEEDIGIEVILQMTNLTRTKNTHVFEISGMYKNKLVGIQIEILSKIQAGFIKNGVKIKSLGTISDNFVEALSDLFKIPVSKCIMTKEMNLTIYSLNSKKVNLNRKEICSLKLFFEKEYRYAELYLGINTYTNEIAFREKDLEYRDVLLKILTN
ncbi:MAG: hypothetical protein LBE91_11540 [Tannerella sp.]|jgi:tmRNA-binding protein|nr:hypothetical protein [Tannerella sp.]